MYNCMLDDIKYSNNYIICEKIMNSTDLSITNIENCIEEISYLRKNKYNEKTPEILKILLNKITNNNNRDSIHNRIMCGAMRRGEYYVV